MTNNIETHLFIGKCLGIRQFPERIPEIREVVASGIIKWENLVWVSSNHRVLPALYLQFNESNLLPLLPEDLVEHMAHLHKMNSQRNEAILSQLNDIITFLNSKGIAPILLKGTAHLMDGLYFDLGERMIGDIDFLVDYHEIRPTVAYLKEKGYDFPNSPSDEELKMMKHYPRLRNESEIAAIEVHRQPVSFPYERKFNFDLINPEKKRLKCNGEAYVLSDRHQIIHNMMNAQMNDFGFKKRKVNLRHSYDLLLLSQRYNTLNSCNQFGHYFRQLNSHLIVSSKMLAYPSSLTYLNNHQARRYLQSTMFFIHHQKWHTAYRVVLYLWNRCKRYITLPIQAIYIKKVRKDLLRRLNDRNWYKAHFASYRSIKNV